MYCRAHRVVTSVVAMGLGKTSAKQCLAEGLQRLTQAPLTSVMVVKRWIPGERCELAADYHAGPMVSEIVGESGGATYRQSWADPLLPKLLSRGGRVVTAMREEVVSDGEWESLELSKRLRAAGCEGLLCGALRLASEEVVVMGVHVPVRTNGSPTGGEAMLRGTLKVLRRVGRELVRQEAKAGGAAGLAADDPALARLTGRERDVFLALLRGMSTKEVAKSIGVKEQTAAGYIKNVYRYFGVHTRAELLAKYIR